MKKEFNQITIEAINDVKNNINLSKSFKTIEELFEELEKDVEIYILN